MKVFSISMFGNWTSKNRRKHPISLEFQQLPTVFLSPLKLFQKEITGTEQEGKTATMFMYLLKKMYIKQIYKFILDNAVDLIALVLLLIYLYIVVLVK